MTAVVDARDVDHAVNLYARSSVCEQHPADDQCARCAFIALLREARRFEAWEPTL